MPAQEAAERTVHEPVRHALPSIRTVVGTELALPLPPPSAPSSGSSWGSAGQNQWETEDVPRPGSSTCSEPRPRDPSSAPHSGLNRDVDVQASADEGASGSGFRSSASPPPSPAAPHSTLVQNRHLGAIGRTRTLDPDLDSDTEAGGGSHTFRRDGPRHRRRHQSLERFENALDLQLSPSLRPTTASSVRRGTRHDMEDVIMQEAHSLSHMESHQPRRRPEDSPMSLDSLLLYTPGNTPGRPRALTAPSPHGRWNASPPTVHAPRSLPPSPHPQRTPHVSNQPPPATPPNPAHYFGVLKPSPSGELINSMPIRSQRRPPSTPQASGSQLSRAGSEDARRHECPVCHKRFNRPSSLQVHARVHNGQRPYHCTYPGCTRAFSVASNMRRHLRTHSHGSNGSSSKGGEDSDGDADGEEPEEAQYQWVASYKGPPS